MKIKKGTYKNYKYLIRKIEGPGHLCGYVAIPKGHEFYGINGNEIPIDCHGGLTFSDFLNENFEETFNGQQRYWWIGFDAAHSWDIVPGLKIVIPGATYKDAEYIEAECKKIIDQLSIRPSRNRR